jgi:hypothetical protein
MSHITKTTQVKPVPSGATYGRAITVALALTAAMIVAAFLLTRPSTAVPSAGGANELTDGYLPGAIAAHSAQQLRNAQALTDGWEARLVGPMRAAQSDVRDGWEAGLVAPRTSSSEITDGWEASLFK